MSSHCLIDWTPESSEVSDGAIDYMALCMEGNRDWTKERMPLTERRWQPPAFAILSAADNLIFFLAVLIDQSGGKVTEAQHTEWIDKSEFPNQEWRENIGNVSKRILQKLGVWEDNGTDQR